MSPDRAARLQAYATSPRDYFESLNGRFDSSIEFLTEIL
jgi:hypothetical protein